MLNQTTDYAADRRWNPLRIAYLSFSEATFVAKQRLAILAEFVATQPQTTPLITSHTSLVGF